MRTTTPHLNQNIAPVMTTEQTIRRRSHKPNGGVVAGGTSIARLCDMMSSIDLTRALLSDDHLDEDILLSASARRTRLLLLPPPPPPTSSRPARRRRSLVLSPVEGGHASSVISISASPEEELPPAMSMPVVVRRPSIVRRSAGLLDAVHSADTTLAKLEAFLSGDDSQAHLVNKGGGEWSKSSLDSELYHLRDSEDAMRRELEGLGMTGTMSRRRSSAAGIMSDDDGSLSLRSWRMASTSSFAYEEDHSSQQDVNDDVVEDDEELELDEIAAAAAAAAKGLSVLRGEWSSSSLDNGISGLYESKSRQLFMSSCQSSDTSLDLGDIFKGDDDDKANEVDCRQDERSSNNHDVNKKIASPSPRKGSLWYSDDDLCDALLSPPPMTDLNETDDRAHESSITTLVGEANGLLLSPSKIDSSSSEDNSSVMSPIGTDISFTESGDSLTRPSSTPALDQSCQDQQEQTPKKDKNKEDVEVEVVDVEQQQEQMDGSQETSYYDTHVLLELPFTNEEDCRLVALTAAKKTVAAAGTARHQQEQSKTRNNGGAALVGLLRWAEKAAEALYGW